MDEMIVKSPAKINIGLNIVSKRDDGFHNLETIFYPLNIFDEIRFTKSDRFSFASNDENLNKEKSNLIIKAKEELERISGKELLVHIYLNKNIPIGAGLGGGSSNAASTLTGLNNFFDLQINKEILLQAALKLGSDVPFFLNPVPSFAESRGEKLYPINLIIDKNILIVNPGIHVSTKCAFSLIKPKQPEKSLKKIIKQVKISFDELKEIATNDFEEIVFEKHQVIKNVKQDLIGFCADFAIMTGTGSTVAGFFTNQNTLKQAEQYFRQSGYFTSQLKI